MSLKMFLNRCLTNRIHHRSSSFCINSLPRKSKILIYTRSAFCTAKLENTDFLRSEEYFHQYIRSKPESYTYYFNTLALEKEVESNTESFESLSGLLNNFEEYSDLDELKKTIATEFNCDVNETCKKIIFIGKNSRRKYENSNKNNYNRLLIRKINDELYEKQLSLDELLKVLFAFKISGLKSYFSNYKILKCLKKICNLTPHQIVQVFFVAPNTNYSKNEEKYNILMNLNNMLPNFNADEFGIISRGLSRLNFTFNHRNIANGIILKMTENIENINSVPLAHMCMAVSKLGNRFNLKLILNLQEKSIPYVSNFKIPALLELSELGIKLGCINSSFWEIVVRKYKENLSNLSPVHIIRIQRQSLIYNTKDNELLKLIIKEYEKYENYTEKLENFVYFLCNLSYCNVYPKNLFDKVFSDETVSKTILSYKNKVKIKLFWWILHTNVEVERPEYLNFTLNSKHRKKLYIISQILMSSNTSYSQKLFKNFTGKIESYLRNIYGEKAVVKTNSLPQYYPGLVLRFNKNLEAQPIPDDFYVDRKSYPKKPLDDNSYWVFLTLISCNHSFINNLTVFAHYPTQYRQLKSLGYIPIMVPVMQYADHVKQNTQEEFITQLLQKKLKEQENILKN